MFFQTYGSAVREDVANWTSNCDYEATVYTSTPTFVLFKVSSSPIDHDAVLKAFFNTSNYFYAVSGLNSTVHAILAIQMHRNS